jgi:hypothetical protein
MDPQRGTAMGFELGHVVGHVVEETGTGFRMPAGTM